MSHSLKSALDQFRLEFSGKIPADVAEAMTRADADLAASGIAARALAAGATAPDFRLRGARGETVTLSALLREGRWWSASIAAAGAPTAISN